ncbi:MAG: hypothetical protein AB7R55_10240 [Gemmatimonadales bacterium]
MTPARLLVLSVLLAATAGGTAIAQKKKSDDEQRCRLELVRVERRGVRVETAPGVVNMFAGGDVHVKCRDQDVNMFADSVAIFGENVAQFIGKVRYRDSTTAMDADFGQYNKVGRDEYFDAQGRVVHTDLATKSTIKGPRIIYYRPIEGIRDEAEVFADRRPTVEYFIEDSTTRNPEPYVIVGDRVKMNGGEALYVAGRVTVDRSDLKAGSDSLWLDTGEANAGQLLGNANLKGGDRDTFDLTGKTIDLSLEGKQVDGMLARENARLVGKDLSLDADSIQLAMTEGKVDVTRAWGGKTRPHAVTEEYEAKGDSLVIESPDQRLSSLRSYGDAWVGLKTDSASGERDWISGGVVEVDFAERDSLGVKTTAVKEVRAERSAHTYYRMAAETPGGRASVNYTRADRIRVVMLVDALKNEVERVFAEGNVDGVHLQPGVLRADSTRADSAARRPNTTRPRR